MFDKSTPGTYDAKRKNHGQQRLIYPMLCPHLLVDLAGLRRGRPTSGAFKNCSDGSWTSNGEAVGQFLFSRAMCRHCHRAGQHAREPHVAHVFQDANEEVVAFVRLSVVREHQLLPKLSQRTAMARDSVSTKLCGTVIGGLSNAAMNSDKVM